MSEPTGKLGIAQRARQFWQRVSIKLFAGYRPERHYMRGPGPKWHARHSPP